jgi:FKBP-type peptidyl-prolyl isomerase-like protein
MILLWICPSTIDSIQPVRWPDVVARVGIVEVIKGWDTGIPGMAAGPSYLVAYSKKALPGIPANSRLAFDVKLMILCRLPSMLVLAFHHQRANQLVLSGLSINYLLEFSLLCFFFFSLRQLRHIPLV